MPAGTTPIRLGFVGTMSGPVGAHLVSYLKGVQIWQKWVNSRGGINGHPVALTTADDGGDPARHKAHVQDLVERVKVLAFLTNGGPITGHAAVSYLETKRIPLVGGTTGEKWAYDSVMQFPQASSGPALTSSLYGSIANQALRRRLPRLAVLSCAEVDLCRDFYNAADKESEKRGMQLVYRVQSSLAQPDYTAECLSARNAGAQVFFAAADSNSLRRLAVSCLRQGYKPLFFSGAQALVDELKEDPNLDNNFIAAFPTFPYWQTDTPAVAQFQEAFRQFGGSIELAGGLTMSWAAGKLFERAARDMPEPPTTEAILQGLWSIKNEDLGGITQPLTFTRGEKPRPSVCWWNAALVDGRWSSPDDYRRHCD